MDGRTERLQDLTAIPQSKLRNGRPTKYVKHCKNCDTSLPALNESTMMVRGTSSIISSRTAPNRPMSKVEVIALLREKSPQLQEKSITEGWIRRTRNGLEYFDQASQIGACSAHLSIRSMDTRSGPAVNVRRVEQMEEDPCLQPRLRLSLPSEDWKRQRMDQYEGHESNTAAMFLAIGADCLDQEQIICTGTEHGPWQQACVPTAIFGRGQVVLTLASHNHSCLRHCSCMAGSRNSVSPMPRGLLMTKLVD